MAAWAADAAVVRAATDAWPVGKSTSDKTTPPPAVAPMAVATKTICMLRLKLFAPATYPHSGWKFFARRISFNVHFVDKLSLG